MATVGIKQLKNQLTQYLRRTKGGEEIIVTERGKPIAIIQPIRSAEVGSREGRLAQLATQGRLTLPTRPPRKKVSLVKVSGPPLSAIVLKDRR